MIVTIDGPAGAGKSSTARELARRLHFQFLDTGAMYRAVALAALRARLDWQDEAGLLDLVAHLRIQLTDDQVLLSGDDVTDAIRAPEVTAVVHHVADPPRIRARLVELQRQLAAGKRIVTEGRDQGTVAFPRAACKIYLTASPEERARRRARQRQAAGFDVDWRQVLEEQIERDRRDRERPVGKLSKAEDAMELVTDGMTLEQVVQRLETMVRQRMAESGRSTEGDNP
jgi:cytidylate kinase